ncbi:MAG: hypothetical protein HN738_02595 [Gammaproteobacteria bacterium]|nr:hypothetical protein [Gammaproteobacteria bacterium]
MNNNTLEKNGYGLVKDVPCSSCTATIPEHFSFLVERGEAFCMMCAVENDKAIKDFVESNETDSQRSTDFEARIRKIAVSDSFVKTLRLTPESQDNRLGGKLGESMDKYVSARVRGVLVLSGTNGVGKTVAASYAAWRSNGRFMARSEWMGITAFGESGELLRDLMTIRGVVVLDEVAPQTTAGDSPNCIRVVSTILCERHDKGLPTIITTRSSKDEFTKIYGNDILDRTRAYVDKCGSGWVTMKGKSRR